MKKIFSALIIMALTVLLFNGCMLSSGRGPIVEKSLTLRNLTGYEIESFGLIFLGSTYIARVNPMEYPVEEDQSLKPGEERTFTFNIGENETLENWGINFGLTEELKAYTNGILVFDGASGYDISFNGFTDDGDMAFSLISFDEVRIEPKNTTVLIADMSLGSVYGDEYNLISQYEYGYDGSVSVDVLAKGLSVLTGLNFAIKDSSLNGNRVNVD